MTGREAPKLEEFTFPETNRTVRIRKVSPLLMQEVLRAWVKKNPEPQPPQQEVKYGDRIVLEPNFSNPSYLRQRQLWSERQNSEVGEITLKLLIERGVEVEFDPAEIAEMRKSLLEDFDIDLSGLSDKYVYVAYVCVGTDSDLEDLRDKIIARSQPTSKEVEDNVSQFRRPS